MSKPDALTEKQVLEIIQQRWPREYEIAVQQAYIANLESALAEKDESSPDDGE